MIQSTVKSKLEKIQSLVQPQLTKVNQEGRSFLKDMGADFGQGHSLADIVGRLRQQNPSLKTFLYNLDAATYDARKRIEWNANMLPAFAKIKAGKKYKTKVKPVIDGYIETAEDYYKKAENRVKDLTNKTTELGNSLKSKVSR